MSQQIEMFQPLKPDNYFPIKNSWYIEASNKSTAESQYLVFECAGLKSSRWLINAIDREVIFISGDSFREPQKEIVDAGCIALIEMTKSGLLFPLPLNEVIFRNAWQKGYDAGFNEECADSNHYPKGTLEYAGWIEGWNEGSMS